MIRKTHVLLAAALLAGALSGCGSALPEEDTITVAAATYPVYLLASAVTQGVNGVEVIPVVNQSVACVHDYTLSVTDMKALEGADVVLLSGVGLEDFMSDAIAGFPTIDCSQGVELLEEGGHEGHDHEHEDEDSHGDHDMDPHIWLDPNRAAVMTENIANGLAQLDPDHAQLYAENAQAQVEALHTLSEEGADALADLSCRELITFHEGFAYFADAFDLEIVAAIEEEAGSEASAKTIVEMVEDIRTHQLPAIFVEENGSDATAKAIQRECGVEVYALTMMMSGPEEYGPDNCYATYLRKNINVIKEALG